jgi:hypothetical protein
VTAAEVIARRLLDSGVRKLRFDLVDETEARRALAERFPGNVLQDVMRERARMIEEETIRVQSVIAHLLDLTGITIAELELRPELEPTTAQRLADELRRRRSG